MTIETLIRAVQPPEAATYVFNGPWEPIEKKIGIQLPQDYKDLARVYGAGRFMGFLGIYDPAGPNPGCRLFDQVCEVARFFPGVLAAVPDLSPTGRTVGLRLDGHR